jgi:hypothetical protein
MAHRKEVQGTAGGSSRAGGLKAGDESVRECFLYTNSPGSRRIHPYIAPGALSTGAEETAQRCGLAAEPATSAARNGMQEVAGSSPAGSITESAANGGLFRCSGALRASRQAVLQTVWKRDAVGGRGHEPRFGAIPARLSPSLPLVPTRRRATRISQMTTSLELGPPTRETLRGLPR